MKANIIGKIYSENTNDKSEGFAGRFSFMLIPSADEKLKDMFYNFPSQCNCAQSVSHTLSPKFPRTFKYFLVFNLFSKLKVAIFLDHSSTNKHC